MTQLSILKQIDDEMQRNFPNLPTTSPNFPKLRSIYMLGMYDALTQVNQSFTTEEQFQKFLRILISLLSDHGASFRPEFRDGN